MATVGGVMKQRRRPTTYGKASRRAIVGFQDPALSANSGTSSGTQNEHGISSRHQIGRPVSPEIALQAPDPTKPSDQSISTAARKPRADKILLAPAIPDQSLYEVPTSDEDRPPNQASRLSAKRRRIRTKAHEKTTQGVRAVAESESQSLQKHSPGRSVLSRQDLPNAGEPIPADDSSQSEEALAFHNMGKERLPAANEAKLPGPLSALQIRAATDLSENAPCLRPAFRPINRVVGENRSGSMSTERDGRKRRTLHNDENTTHPPRAPQSTSGSNVPRTPSPASGRTEKQKGPTRDLEPAHEEQTTFLSPGGLDFPSLLISDFSESHLGSTQSHGYGSQGNSQTSTNRRKLKDRLASKDGVKHHESSSASETMYSPDEEVIFDRMAKNLSDHDAGGVQPDSQVSTASQMSQPVTASSVHGTGPKVTYAARQRTLRSEENQDDMLLGISMVEDLASERAARRIRVEAFDSIQSQSSTQEDEEPNNSQATSIRTIHELREAGENARLFGQTETLLEDIDSQNISTKRSGLLALSIKLDQPAFRAQFLANGLEARLLAHVRSSNDPIVNIFMSMAMLRAISSHKSRHLLEQFEDQEVFKLMLDLLDQTDGVPAIVKTRKSNTTKNFQKETEEACRAMLKSSLWRHGPPTQVTPRSLSLQCLEYLVRQLREAGRRGNILSQDLTGHLVKILADTLPTLADRPAIPKNESDVQLALSILESSTLSSSMQDELDGGFKDNNYLEMMARFLASSCEWQSKNQARIWTLTLRLCLNLTNNNTLACSVFSRSEVLDAVIRIISLNFEKISTEVVEASRALMLDNLILSLGFLINLAERREDSRSLFLVSSPGLQRPVDILLQIFTSRWIRAFEVVSEEESRASVPLGYLAVLLSILSIDRSLRTQIASKFEGGTLKHLLVAVDEFLNYNRKVTEQSSVSSDEVDAKALFTSRLQAVVDKLKMEEELV